MTVQWQIPVWGWPVLVAAAVACAWWTWRAYADTTPAPAPRVRRLLASLRVAVCLAVLLAVAGPLLVRTRTVVEPAVVALVVEDSGSMALADGPAGPDRWRRAWDAVAMADSVLAASGDAPDVIVMQGNGRAAPVPRILAEAVVDTPRAVGTDLASLVAQVRQQLLARQLRGIVLVSDGHGEPAAAAMSAGVPVVLAGVGEAAGGADRYLADLRYPDRVHRGEPMTVEVAVGQRREAGAATPADSLRVTLSRDGEVVAEAKAPAADLVRRDLVFTPDRTGLTVLEVAVEALDNERFPGNNRATIAVDVRPDRSRVLLLAPVPGWDVRFLAQAARREARLGLTVVQPGPTGPVLADSLVAWQAPMTASAWTDAWDAVVLAGPPGAWLPDVGVSLAAAVNDGLGLLMLAADGSSERRARPWPVPLLNVAPVQTVGDLPTRGDFVVAAAAGGATHPVTGGLGDGLGDLPPLRWLQRAQARTGGDVLLEAAAGGPVLVVGRPGRGRTLWFGGRRLWEQAFWQLPAQGGEGEHPGARLLRQMLLWTTLGDDAGGIALLGSRLVFEEGEPVPVAVSWRDLGGDPVVGRPMVLDVAAEGGGEARTFALQPDPARPGVAVGTVPPLPPGRWVLTPRGGGDDGPAGDPRRVVVTRAGSEQAQVGQDRRALRQLAGRLGGAYVDLAGAGGRDEFLAAVAELEADPVPVARRSRHEPAAGWPWLVLSVGLLGAEWSMRRRQGLL